MVIGENPGNTSVLNTSQINTVFDTMSDGVLIINSLGIITYANPACHLIFKLPEEILVIGNSFETVFLSNRKNKSLHKYYNTLPEHSDTGELTSVTYQTETGEKVSLDIQASFPGTSVMENVNSPSSGTMLLIKDKSAHTTLRQTERDCAFIFSGLIICITIYLMAWKCMRFTLGLHLTTAGYTLIIEGITFLLFLEIIFMTSFSLKDLGLLPGKKKILRNMKETFLIILIFGITMVIFNSILFLTGHQVKNKFIGGSPAGAMNYVLTAFVQEFLARGVIQNCIKALVKIKYQKFFSILLTSLLFSLMHMPFRFYFMLVAFLLSMVLGYLYERHGDLWSCFILHWFCGYLTMCMFF